jgi:hypothetical protein
MTIRNELLVFAADPETGIYLVNGPDGALLGDVIESDQDMHWEMEKLIARVAGKRSRAVVLHSTSTTAPHVEWTSWHPWLQSQVNTYIAIVAAPGYVLDSWPGAAPVDMAVARAWGAPRPHGAAEVPVPRSLDVIFHALGHIRWLMDNNGPVIADMLGAGIYETWQGWIADFRPFLAKMYREPDAAVA